MKILLTNDDGIESKSLQSLAARLRETHDVWIVAPADQMSASSHAITLREPIKIKKYADRDIACWGSPADCVSVALQGIVKETFDLVLSGINYGPNVGTDVIYSGTAAAARQGALMGIPSVAASLYAFEGPFYFDYPIEFLVQNVGKLKDLWHPDHFININFPNLKKDIPGAVITHPSRRIYQDKLVTYDAPNGCIYAFWDGNTPVSEEKDDTDYLAIMHNKIAISPISIHPENIDNWEEYLHVGFWKGAEEK